MAERIEGTTNETGGESGGDSGGTGVVVGEQVEFTIDREPTGGASGDGSGDGGTKQRRKRRTRAEIDAAESPEPVSARVSGDIRSRIIDGSKMLQRRFGGMILVQDKRGQVHPEELWVLSREEADALVSAIDGVRSKLPMMPEKWSLPIAVGWLGGVVLWTFGNRVAVWRQLQAQAAAQMAAQQHQATAQAAYHPNGAQPDMGAAGGIPVTPDGEPPPDWDALLRGGGGA